MGLLSLVCPRFGCCWRPGWRDEEGGHQGGGRMVKSCFVSTPGPFGMTPCGERDRLPLLNIPAAIQCCRRDLIPLQIPWLRGLVEKHLQHQPPSLGVGAGPAGACPACPVDFSLPFSRMVPSYREHNTVFVKKKPQTYCFSICV